jgi:hypothetical protein
MSDGFQDFDRYDESPDGHLNIKTAIFGALSGFFVLLTLIGFSVAFGKYRTHVSKYPDLDFDFPSTAVIVLHFFCGFFGAILFGLIALVCGAKRAGGWWLCAIIFSGIAFLAFWIAYGVVAGISREFNASGNLLTYSDYGSYSNAIVHALPGVTFNANAPNRNNWACSWESRSFLGLSGVDNTTMPTIEPDQGQVWRVASSVSVTWVIESRDRIRDEEFDLEAFLKSRDPYMDWRVSGNDYVDGLKENVIVSDNDKLPTQFSRSRGIAAAFFWSGIIHSFEIDEIPVLRAVAVKTGAEMRELPPARDLGYPSCHRVSRTKTPRYYYAAPEE